MRNVKWANGFYKIVRRRIVWAALLSLAAALALPALAPRRAHAQGPTFSDSGQTLGDAYTYGVALGDLDGDGDLDAFIVNADQPNWVWFNNGNGNFTDSGQALGTSTSYDVALGDLDGDGDLDAFIGNSGNNKVWLNDGLGNFTDSGQTLGVSGSVAVALGDLNGNGYLDVFVGNSGGNKVWLNIGGGVFSPTVQSLGSSTTYDVALGDLNGDGYLDAFAANYNGQANKIWLNDRNGAFTDSGQSLGSFKSRGVALGDFDDDGSLDAFVVNDTGDQVSGQANQVYLNNGSGVFNMPPQSLENLNSRDVALGDLDGDGDLDAFVVNLLSNNVTAENRVYLNDGNGGFTKSGQALGDATSLGVAVGDLDGDGDLDAFIGNGRSFPNQVYLNQSEVFDNGQDIGDSGYTQGLALGDLDNDGDLDAFIGNWGTNRILLNDGNGTFSDSGQTLGTSTSSDIALGDLDGDGDLDAFVGNQGTNRVWLNDGTGNFTASNLPPNSSTSYNVALGDLDGDGDLDAFVANESSSNRVWLNNGGLQGGTPGTFSDSGQSLGGNGYSRAVALGDLDGDGDLDAFVGNGNYEANEVYFNNGFGIFSDSGQSIGNGNNQSVALGDLDGDGDLDAFIAGGNALEPNLIYLNDGTGKFSVTGQTLGNARSRSAALGDLDGDGDLDAFVGNSAINPGDGEVNRVYLNNGSGYFSDSGQNIGTSSSFDVALGDLNGDGDLDAFVGNLYNQSNQVYKNLRGASNRVQITTHRPISTQDANFYSTPITLTNTTIPLTYTLFDPEGDRVGRVEAQYSPNGGGQWFPATSALGSALAFDGVDDYVEIPHSNSINFGVNDDFTVELWVKAALVQADDASNHNDILAKWTGGGGYPYAIRYINQNSSISGTIQGLRYDGTNIPKIQSIRTINDGRFHHIAFVKDGPTLYLYIDGVLDPAGPATDTTVSATTNNSVLTLGQRGNDTRHFDGQIDEVRIWSVARSPAEIKANMYRTLNGDEPGLAAYYPLDENSGVAAFDQTANNNDGSLGGGVAIEQPLWIDDAFNTNLSLGNALAFDGVDDYVDLGPASAVNGLVNNLTVSAWVKFNDLTGIQRIVGAAQTAGADGFAFGAKGSGLRFTTFGVHDYDSTAITLPAGQWVHLAAVLDAANDVTFYVNGVAQETVYYTAPGLANADDPFYFGTSTVIGSSALIELLQGELDEVLIWNTARSAADIQADMRGNIRGDEAGLAGYWPFDTPSQDTVFDQTANNNDGTLGNGVSVQKPRWVGGPFAAYVYPWDTFASGFFGQSDNVVLRMVAYPQLVSTGITGTYSYPNATPGPFQWPYASATTFPFRVRGTQVRVFSSTAPISNAIVYRLPAGQESGGFVLGNAITAPFRTDQRGYLSGRGEIAVGDTLVALAPVQAAQYHAGQLAFDGLDDYVDLGPASAVNGLANNFTVSAWVKFNGLTGVQRIVGAAQTAGANGFAFGTNGTGLRFSTFGVKDYDSTAITLPTGQWVHLAAVLDAANDVTFYVNGVAQETVYHTAPGLANADDPFYFGATTTAGSSAPAELLQGELDEVLIWNTARSAADIQADMRGNIRGDEAGLVGYWPFDTPSQDTVFDQTANGNDGSLRNGAVRQGHSLGGYTVYHTSAQPNTAGLTGTTVIRPGVQVLTVTAQHPLILFDLNVSLEWDARKDTQFVEGLKADLQRASQVLFDATNGQAALGNVILYHNREGWPDAHIQVYATNTLRPNATLGGIRTDVLTEVVTSNPYALTTPYTRTYGPGQIRIGSVWNRFGESSGTIGEDWPRTLVHELGHYLFYLEEDYLGLDANGLAMSVSGCDGSLMNDPYRDDFSEFHPPANWDATCANTLQAQQNQYADWATMRRWYPWLITDTVSLANPGPRTLPLAVTQITEVPPTGIITPTIDVPIFYLTHLDASYTPDSPARAILYQGDHLLDLGQSVRDKVRTWGARPGDRLCVYEAAAQRLGCETVSSGDDQLDLVDKPGWQPDIIITPVSSRTLAITAANISGGTPLWNVYPVNDVATVALSMTQTAVPTIYTGIVTLTLPADRGYIRLWLDEADSPANPRRETITSYSLGGNPGKIGLGWGKIGLGWGKIGLGWGKIGLGWAPVSSDDGQVILFGNVHFAAGEFFALQKTSALPAPPPWATVVGDGYRLIASPNAPSLAGTSLNFRYLGKEVPPGEESFLSLYFWNGASWEKLPTTLNPDFNEASAATQGAGLYALMSSIEIPMAEAGWNLIAYPVLGNRPVTEAMRSIEGYYGLVYGYVATDTVDPWKVYAPSAPPWVNDLHTLRFGQGYWISATQAITWYLKGATGGQARQTTGLQSPPATYYGPILSDATFAPVAGMTVTARINGHLCGQTRTRPIDGGLAFSLNVRADEPSQAAGCGASGRVIEFWVGEHKMVTTAVWNSNRLGRVVLSPEGTPPRNVYLPLVLKGVN